MKNLADAISNMTDLTEEERKQMTYVDRLPGKVEMEHLLYVMQRASLERAIGEIRGVSHIGSMERYERVDRKLKVAIRLIEDAMDLLE